MCLSCSDSLKSTQKHNSKTTKINPLTAISSYTWQATFGKHTTAALKHYMWRQSRILNTNGTALRAAGRLPPSQAACGTRGPVPSGCVPSTAHSNTAGRLRWHRRTEQTFHRCERRRIRRRSGHPERMVSPQPGITEHRLHLNHIASAVVTAASVITDTCSPTADVAACTDKWFHKAPVCRSASSLLSILLLSGQ